MMLLSAGHYPQATGACFPPGNHAWNEHDIAVDWVNRIAHRAREQVAVAVVPTGWLGDKVRWINTQNAEFVAELHFNSDPTHSGNGCETLYYPRSARGERAAQIVQESMSSMFPPNRGIREGWYRQDAPGHVDYPGDVEGDEKIDYFLAKTNTTSLILEPEFIHNRTVIESVRDIACEIIADALVAAVHALRGMQV